MKTDPQILSSVQHHMEESLRDLEFAIFERTPPDEAAVFWVPLEFLQHFYPLEGEYCYFCLEYFDCCAKCPYGAVHGVCNERGSDWQKLSGVGLALEDVMSNPVPWSSFEYILNKTKLQDIEDTVRSCLGRLWAHVKELGKCETVEEWMQKKQELLLLWADVIEEIMGEVAQYRVSRVLKVFRWAVKRYYYRGERYDAER